jgi:4-hydroxybenzoate polyprenyltransferase
MMILSLVLLLVIPDLGWIYFFGVIVTAGLLFYEHSLVRADDLSLVNVAFFNVNGIISILLMFFVIVDCALY